MTFVTGLLSSIWYNCGMEITARPLWRDYSANQDKQDTPQLINVKTAKDHGVVGIISRSGSSWTYKDPTFNYVYEQAGILGLYRSSYHNFSPGADPNNQIKNWLEQHPTTEVVPRFAAVEINWNKLSPANIASSFKSFSNIYLKTTGERPGIYTRKNLADLWLTPYLDAEFLNEHWWWLAQYDALRHTEEEKAIKLPNKVNLNRVVLKQTADQMAGFPGEAESSYVDRDRWVATAPEQMNNWIAINWAGTTSPVPCDCELLKHKVSVLENLTQEINNDLEQLSLSTETDITNLQDDIARVKALHESDHKFVGLKLHSHPQWMQRFVIK